MLAYIFVSAAKLVRLMSDLFGIFIMCLYVILKPKTTEQFSCLAFMSRI